MTKRISSILFALLLSAALLSSCGGNNDDTTDTNDTNVSDTAGNTDDTSLNDTTAGPNDTAGEDTSADDTTEDTADDGESAEGTSGEPVTSVTSAEDAIAFIDNNVYPMVSDYLPMMITTRELDLTDMEGITYNTGLEDLTGVTNIVLSESGVGSFAYSFVYVMTDGTNTAEIQTALGEKIQPNKWVCVTAEKISSIQLDNDIILVMGAPEQVDAIMNAVVSAADGVYETVGDVTAVLG